MCKHKPLGSIIQATPMLEHHASHAIPCVDVSARPCRKCGQAIEPSHPGFAKLFYYILSLVWIALALLVVFLCANEAVTIIALLIFFAGIIVFPFLYGNLLHWEKACTPAQPCDTAQRLSPYALHSTKGNDRLL